MDGSLGVAQTNCGSFRMTFGGAFRWSWQNSGTLLASFAFLLALAVSILIMWPGAVTGSHTCTSEAGKNGEDSVELHCTKDDISTVDDAYDGQGRTLFAWGIVLSFIASAPLVFRRRIVRAISGVLLACFVVIGAMTIGLLYAPAALVMLLSIVRRSGPRSGVSNG
jgi:hypothetical protein